MKFKANIIGKGEVEIELSNENIEAIGKVYMQLLEPAVEETGVTLKTIPSFFNNLAHPIHMKRLANKHEYEMAELMYKKLKEAFDAIPVDKYIESRLSMCMAAEDTFPNVFYDENLSDMFIELFRKSAHQDYAHSAAELFMGVLKNMTPQDAVLIKQGHYLEKPRPLIRIFECETLGGCDEDMENAGMFGFYTAPHKDPIFSHYALSLSNPSENERGLSISIYNLRRHELINTDYIERIIKPDGYKTLYEQLIKSDFYKSCKEEALQKGTKLCLTRGYTSPTDLGKLFFDVCCNSL